MTKLISQHAEFRVSSVIFLRGSPRLPLGPAIAWLRAGTVLRHRAAAVVDNAYARCAKRPIISHAMKQPSHGME
ncbi:hypothetical protein [Xanthomonas codiaei]|uniref:hypothetical protein n=1 Tax=Xanthomonas codiaei TaxID=56463 RepID=UPI001E526FE4|nr:hypothetical protein [Xanthomonas codiaei]